MMALAHGHSTLATVAVAASLMHVLNHAIFKGLLFLGAGSVVMATGTRHIEQFGGLGLFPGFVLRALEGVTASLPGLQPPAAMAWGRLGMSSALPSFDHVVPTMFGFALLGGLIVSTVLTARRGVSVRQAPTWGCGGELTPRTEYSATAFSKPLLMIFGSVYRPTRQVDAVAEVSPYFVHEVRYRTEIEPTFERYLYGPLVRGVVRIASGLKVLQAGSLHAYLAYVLVLAVILLMWLGGTT